MTTPGFSVTELLKAARRAKGIWDSFADEYENAPAKLKELVDTCKYLHDILHDFSALLGYYDQIYPQEGSFGRKLEECERFIDKYKTLKEGFITKRPNVTFGAKLLTAPLQAFQTTRYSFDDQRARDLKDGLSLEIQQLLLFCVVSALYAPLTSV